MRKQKGFSLIELLIVVAIILIIAAIAIPNLMSARRNANQSAGAATIRTINTAEVTFSTNYTTTGYANTLTVLGPGTATCTTPSTISNTGACLIDGVLGCATQPCIKGVFAYSLSSTSSAAPFGDYMVTAIGQGTSLTANDYCAVTDAVVRSRASTGATGTIATPAICGGLNAI